MLRDRMREEIDAKLEEHEDLFRPSTPFLKIIVESSNRRNDGKFPKNRCDEALLTVWNPSDQQLESIRDGALIRVKNLAVKDTRFDGILQLSANGRTEIKALSDDNHSLKEPKIGDNIQIFCRIFKIQVLSKNTLSNEVCPQEINVVGIVLKFELQAGGSGWSFHLTDTSGLVLRVQCHLQNVGQHSSITSLSQIAKQNVAGASVITVVRGLRVLPFDYANNCAVAEFIATSSIQPVSTAKETEKLLRWSCSDIGRKRLELLALHVNVGISRFNQTNTELVQAIGHVSGFQVLKNQQLFISVDCGGSLFQTWKFPLSRIKDFAKLCQDLDGSVVLNLEEEAKIAALASLGRIFRARQSLYRFSLRRLSDVVADFPECCYEVMHVTKADTEALASLYASTLRMQ